MIKEIQLRWIMTKAPDHAIIRENDSIDQRCVSHRGVVMAPRLACNVPGAVGKRAGEFNRAGLQVWRGRMLPVRDHKIVRVEVVL